MTGVTADIAAARMAASNETTGGQNFSDSNTVAMARQRYMFSEASKSHLVGVKPELTHMAVIALALSTQDFGITDGVRTVAEQQKAVMRGDSQTMHSMHLIQPDGYGWAIDATPYDDSQGRFVWEWPLIYPVAAAFHQAAVQIGIASNVRWGGAWDRRLSDLGSTPQSFAQAVQDYTNRHGGKAFLDGPHYEWVP